MPEGIGYRTGFDPRKRRERPARRTRTSREARRASVPAPTRPTAPVRPTFPRSNAGGATRGLNRARQVGASPKANFFRRGNKSFGFLDGKKLKELRKNRGQSDVKLDRQRGRRLS